MLNEQAKVADNEQPKLLSSDIAEKAESLKREVSYLVTKIKYFRPKTTKKPASEEPAGKNQTKNEEKPAKESENESKKSDEDLFDKEETKTNETEQNEKENPKTEDEESTETDKRNFKMQKKNFFYSIFY